MVGVIDGFAALFVFTPSIRGTLSCRFTVAAQLSVPIAVTHADSVTVKVVGPIPSGSTNSDCHGNASRHTDSIELVSCQDIGMGAVWRAGVAAVIAEPYGAIEADTGQCPSAKPHVDSLAAADLVSSDR